MSPRVEPDHPRVRGERGDAAAVDVGRAGSSPRARRTQWEQVSNLLEVRIIPACAENAELGARGGQRWADHPRVRGERHLPRHRRLNFRGSSPRARRTLPKAHSQPSALRIIPACAENAGRGGARRDVVSDHPRVRGERRYAPTWACHVHGSSPRARRTPAHVAEHGRAVRIIPACAENATRRTRRRPTRTDHPRVRGERRGDGLGILHKCGSSPRARRTQDGVARCDEDVRIIPACAENAG